MSLFGRGKIHVHVPKYVTTIVAAIGVLFLAGCTVGPNYRRPAAEVPPAYKEVGDWKPAQPNDQNIGGNWWEIFQDAQLNALEAQVNVSNQNLKAAEAQYTQSRAALRYQRADLFPTLAGRVVSSLRGGGCPVFGDLAHLLERSEHAAGKEQPFVARGCCEIAVQPLVAGWIVGKAWRVIAKFLS